MGITKIQSSRWQRAALVGARMASLKNGEMGNGRVGGPRGLATPVITMERAAELAALVGARMANLKKGGERGNQYTGGKPPVGALAKPAITIERAAEPGPWSAGRF